MSKRRSIFTIMFSLVSMFVLSSTVVAAPVNQDIPSSTTVIIEGRPSSMQEYQFFETLKPMHCHDAAGLKVVTCFDTDIELTRDLLRYGIDLTKKSNQDTITRRDSASVTSSCSLITRVYKDPYYRGSSFAACNPQTDLSTNGFANNISSLVTYTEMLYCIGVNYGGGRCLKASAFAEVDTLGREGFSDYNDNIESFKATSS